jgi:single-stranded-DNA-specific exonuclease
MQKRWLMPDQVSEKEVQALSGGLKIDTHMAELLLQRNIDSAEKATEFFKPKKEALHDPFLMLNMQSAALRLSKAIDSNERVMLYGDYDVDGTTSVAMMYQFLKNHLSKLEYYIPDRYAEGYGVSETGMNMAIENKVDLIITLDCGIKNVKTLNDVIDKGVDVIVCDHHEPGTEIPKGIVLDPKQKDCLYPFKELSGCGVGFKLLTALVENGFGKKEELFGLLDFLALSIGADLVSILGENRVFASHGMALLNKDTRPCFAKMLSIAKKDKPLTITDVVFTIAPRINAAGRMNLGTDAVKLMLCEDEAEIERIAHQIEGYNRERRELDESTTEEALDLILNEVDPKSQTTVVCNNQWSKGVLGIVASRLIEKHYRPTLVLTEEDGICTGSARTVGDFNIYEALNACSEFFTKFGGHQHAAGLSMKRENLSSFCQKFEKEVSKRILPEEKSPFEMVSLELKFSDIIKSKSARFVVPRLKLMLDKMEPFGPGNLKPVFLSRNIYTTSVKVLKEKHLKLGLIDPESNIELAGIAFFQGEKAGEIASGIPIDILYTIELNSWQNRTSLQLIVKDIRTTEIESN